MGEEAGDRFGIHRTREAHTEDVRRFDELQGCPEIRRILRYRERERGVGHVARHGPDVAGGSLAQSVSADEVSEPCAMRVCNSGTVPRPSAPSG